MSDQKSRPFRPPLYHRGARDHKAPEDGRESEAKQKDDQGWDAYRKWLSRVSTKPTTERVPVDHSVYSWRGYHNWADKVRQSWKAEENS
ncbi:MAG TPA: hypothetical protein VIN61_05915 [Gammaproteobacteria bacterium]